VLIIERIRTGAHVNEQSGDCEPILRHSEQERRTASLIARFQICPRPNSECCGGRVTALRRGE
jgi:hypothetical protein